MNPTLLRAITTPQSYVIPPSIRNNCLAFWDAGNQKPIYYGMNQLVINGSFESGITGWSSVSVGSILTTRPYAGTYSVLNASYGRQEITGLTNGNKIYVCEWHYLEAYTSGSATFGVYDTGAYTNGAGVVWDTTKLGYWIKCSTIKTVVNNGVRICLQADSLVGTSYRDALMAFDLTYIFGAGNEPSTAEMDAILAACGTNYWDGIRQVCINPRVGGIDTITLNQLISNGNFANGVTGWGKSRGTLTASGNIGTLTCDDTGSNVEAHPTSISGVVANKKYYIYAYVRVTNAVAAQIGLEAYHNSATTSIKTINSPTANQWYLLSGIFTATANLNITVQIRQSYADAATANGKVMEIQSVMVFCLTDVFGTDNDTISAVQMDELLAYCPAYWEGNIAIANPLQRRFYLSDNYGKIAAKYKDILNSFSPSGDFEVSDLTGYTLLGSPVLSTEQAKNGTKSLKCIPTGSGVQGLRKDIVSANGDKWHITAWMHISSYTSGNITIRGYDYNTYDNVASQAAVNTILNSWQKLSVEKVAGNGGIRVGIEGGSVAVLTAYVDCLMAINKTAIWGAGNEPSTAQMDAIIAYTGTTYWDGTRSNVLINPEEVSLLGSGKHSKLANMAYTGASGFNNIPFIKGSMVQYTPSSWTEWTQSGCAANGDGSYTLTQTASAPMTYCQIVTVCKASVKYGLLLNSTLNEWDSNLQLIGGQLLAADTTFLNAGYTGNLKFVFTTQSTISSNYLGFKRAMYTTAGLRLKLKDIRLFELPSGSQIETDFTNLSADELNAKYPFEYVSNPPTGLSFDGTDDYGIANVFSDFNIANAPLAIFVTFKWRPGTVTYLQLVNRSDSDDATTQYYLGLQLGAMKPLVYLEGGSKGGSWPSNCLQFNKIYTIGFVWNGSSIKMYLNGVHVGTDGSYSGMLTQRTKFTLGRKPSSSEYFKGEMYNVSMFNKALSDADVKNFYNANCKRYGLSKI